MKHLPSVDKIVSDPSLHDFESKLHRDVRVRIVREVIENHRQNRTPDISHEAILSEVKNYFSTFLKKGLRRAVNATGIVLHTNLGRAPLGKAAVQKLSENLWGYSTLELDTETGERGGRGSALEKWVCLLTGAESALVVNNNAAAVWLALFAMARDKEVLISRGELVQIGGGFKVPEILEAAGAKLVEVGTTNITSVEDYKQKLSKDTAAILRVHQSNFVISGHTKSPSGAELVKLGEGSGIPVIVDLGSGELEGSILEPHEPNVREALHQGAGIVTFSGDKLLGGPQAGFIVGKKECVKKIRASPLYRALRLGKTELFLLEETIRRRIESNLSETDHLIQLSVEAIQKSAERIKSQLAFLPGVTVKESTGSVGGGAMPGQVLPTFIVDIPLKETERWYRALLAVEPAIVCRRQSTSLQIDPRTVFEEEIDLLVNGFRKVFACLS